MGEKGPLGIFPKGPLRETLKRSPQLLGEVSADRWVSQIEAQIEDELKAAQDYRRLAREAEALGDYYDAEKLREIAIDEDKHWGMLIDIRKRQVK